MWKKKGKRNEGSLPIQELQTSSGGYGVTVKDSAKPRDFNPLCIPYDPAELEQQFKAGLLETFCDCSQPSPRAVTFRAIFGHVTSVFLTSVVVSL